MRFVCLNQIFSPKLAFQKLSRILVCMSGMIKVLNSHKIFHFKGFITLSLHLIFISFLTIHLFRQL